MFAGILIKLTTRSLKLRLILPLENRGTSLIFLKRALSSRCSTLSFSCFNSAVSSCLKTTLTKRRMMFSRSFNRDFTEIKDCITQSKRNNHHFSLKGAVRGQKIKVKQEAICEAVDFLCRLPIARFL